MRDAARNWRAAHGAMVQMKDESGARLADGYASALEMVLRPEPQQKANLCPGCGWSSHERPENAREYERSWEVHNEHLCPARVTA